MNRSKDIVPGSRYTHSAFFTVLLLSFTLGGLFVFTSAHSRKTYAASGEVYPAPITEFSTPTQNSWPDGITAGPDGNLWFTEYNASEIGRATPGGTITEFPLPTGSSPTGITAGPDGNLWFTERYGDAIGRISPAGVITQFPYTYSAVDSGSLTAGPDGNLWFADYSGGIGRITPQGTVTEFPLPTPSINPATITVGPDSKLWFTSISQVGNITVDGGITEFSLDNGYSFPDGITTGLDGNLWFTEQNSSGNAIGRITPTGVITDFPLPSVTYPDGTTWAVQPAELTAGPDGDLWFTVNSQSLIGQITPVGAITLYVPLNSSSFGCCIAPTGITAGPDGNLWFADYGFNKVGYLAVGGTNPTPTPTQIPSTPTLTPTPCASGGNTQAQSALALIPTPSSCTNLWGVDSASSLDTVSYTAVAESYGVPDFWGRYIGVGNPKNHSDMNQAEASFAHQHGLAIIPIYADFVNGVTTALQGRTYAKAAIKAAQGVLNIPAGRAIFLNIEPNVSPTAAFIQGWYDQFNTTFTYTSNKQSLKYDAGFYKVGYYGASNQQATTIFDQAYCGAVNGTKTIKGEPQIGTNSFIWASYPTSLNRGAASTMPPFGPYKPNCASNTAVWQYGVQSSKHPVPPNVDTDEAHQDLPLWYP